MLLSTSYPGGERKMTLYRYVGPEDIGRRAAQALPDVKIGSPDDVEGWFRRTGQKANQDGLFVATFIVDEEGCLRIADRGSEHVACAGGRPVLSAGEMFFLAEDGLRVEEVSNQFTGYCPEPESWPAVSLALDRIGIPHPGRFTLEIIFRRCLSCGERSIVKDGWFVCGLCGADLSPIWNFRP